MKTKEQMIEESRQKFLRDNIKQVSIDTIISTIRKNEEIPNAFLKGIPLNEIFDNLATDVVLEDKFSLFENTNHPMDSRIEKIMGGFSAEYRTFKNIVGVIRKAGDELEESLLEQKKIKENELPEIVFDKVPNELSTMFAEFGSEIIELPDVSVKPGMINNPIQDIEETIKVEATKIITEVLGTDFAKDVDIDRAIALSRTKLFSYEDCVILIPILLVVSRTDMDKYDYFISRLSKAIMDKIDETSENENIINGNIRIGDRLICLIDDAVYVKNKEVIGDISGLLMTHKQYDYKVSLEEYIKNKDDLLNVYNTYCNSNAENEFSERIKAIKFAVKDFHYEYNADFDSAMNKRGTIDGQEITTKQEINKLLRNMSRSDVLNSSLVMKNIYLELVFKDTEFYKFMKTITSLESSTKIKGIKLQQKITWAFYELIIRKFIG